MIAIQQNSYLWTKGSGFRERLYRDTFTFLTIYKSVTFLGVWATAGSAQELFLVLHSGFISGGDHMGSWGSNLGQAHERQGLYLPYYFISPSVMFYFNFIFKKYLFLSLGGGRSHLAMLRAYSWCCAQDLLLVLLEVPYGMPRLELGLAKCKVNIALTPCNILNTCILTVLIVITRISKTKH